MHVNSPGDDSKDLSSRHRAERYLPLLPIGGAMFMLSALVYFRLRHDSLEVRSPLQVLVAWSYQTFGLAPGILGCVLLLTWGSIWFVNGRCERVGSRLARIAAMVVLLGVFFNLGENGPSPSFHKGTLGAYLAGTIADVLGVYPGIVLVWAMTVASLLLATDFGFREEWERLRANRGAPGEAGVEDEVAEVLKGLGAGPAVEAPLARTPSPAAGPAAAGAVAAAAEPPPALAATERSASAAGSSFAFDDTEVDVQPEEPEEPVLPTRSRRSYFERRHAQAIEAASGDDEWSPAAPENQDIDNPEAEILADGGDAADAPAADSVLPAADAAGAASAPVPGLQQRGLFDDPLPAPRAPVGGWIAAAAPDDAPIAVPAAAPAAAALPAGEEPLDEPLDEPLEEALDDDVLVLDDDLAPVAVGRDDEPADGTVFEASATGPADDFADDAPVAAADGHAAGSSRDRAAAPPDEVVVPIPRPTAPPARAPAASSFPESLVAEAIDVVVGSGRASATLLQRKLRLEFAVAEQLLGELARRGIVELGDDAAHGRVLR